MTTPRKPQRIQLRRTKGWRKPEDAVVVARPSKWGNPWRVGSPIIRRSFLGEVASKMTHEDAVTFFERSLHDGHLRFTADDVRRELHGRDLACWCPIDADCHADVLLELANAPAVELVDLASGDGR